MRLRRDTCTQALGLSLALNLMLAAAPAHAVDLSASSASSATSASLGSVSTSLETSSNSSSKTTQVAEGDYRILAVAELADKPGLVEMQLQALATPAAAPVRVRLPEPALARHGLKAGDTVAAVHRPYGLELARADDRSAFFLVLEDHWYEQLKARPVTL